MYVVRVHDTRVKKLSKKTRIAYVYVYVQTQQCGTIFCEWIGIL